MNTHSEQDHPTGPCAGEPWTLAAAENFDGHHEASTLVMTEGQALAFVAAAERLRARAELRAAGVGDDELPERPDSGAVAYWPSAPTRLSSLSDRAGIEARYRVLPEAA